MYFLPLFQRLMQNEEDPTVSLIELEFTNTLVLTILIIKKRLNESLKRRKKKPVGERIDMVIVLKYVNF